MGLDGTRAVDGAIVACVSMKKKKKKMTVVTMRWSFLLPRPPSIVTRPGEGSGD